MKIVFLINSLTKGGAERVLCTLATEFSSRENLEVVILTLEKGISAYELPEAVRVLPLASSCFIRGPSKLLALPVAAVELLWRIRSLRPNAIISFLVRANLVSLLAQKIGRVENLTISERTIASKEYEGTSIKERLMRWLIRHLYPTAKKIIAVSESTKDSLISFGVSSERITVIPNPVSIQEITKLKNEGIGGRDLSRFRIVTAGRLIPLKNHRLVVKAVASLQNRFDIELLVLGDGPLWSELCSLCADLGVKDRVHFLGWQTNPFHIMASSDVFVLTSNFESFGNVVLEALACGLPVIATDCSSSIQMLLQDGKCGVLIPRDDEMALIRELERLISAPEKRSVMKLAGLSRCQDFDVKSIADRYLQVLLA